MSPSNRPARQRAPAAAQASQRETRTRRPGIYKLVAKLKREHPRWSDDRAMAEAKARYTMPGVAAEGGAQ